MRPTEFIAAVRKGKTAAAYYLRGPDRLVHEECRKALLNFLPAEACDWCLTELEFEPGSLGRGLERADQMPMLGGHNWLLYSDPEDFKHASDQDTEALGAYLERPSPFATVVFAAVEPDRRRRFIQLLEKKAEVVEMLPLSRREAAEWAVDFLKKAGVEINRGLAEEIAEKFEKTDDRVPERAGVNLLWMRTELEKLLAAKLHTKRLERQDLELVVAFREEHQIGKLLRAVAERKCEEAFGHLRALLASKTAETLLVWSIGDLFRQALKGASASPFGRGNLSFGGGGRSAVSGLGSGPAPYGTGRGGWNRGPFSTAESAAVALRNYSRPELLQALRLVRQADLGIKSSWKDSRILLEFLVWQLIVGKGSGKVSSWGGEIPLPSAEA